MASFILKSLFGVGLTAIVSVPLVMNLLATNTKDATVVRIVLGSNADRSASFGGSKPGASLWDFNGNAIGFARGSDENVVQGAFVDITINPRKEVGNIQPAYLSVTSGSTDAVCIDAISLTFPDGATTSFNGSTAAKCNGTLWAYSRTTIVDPGTGKFENSKCFWIGTDGSKGAPHQGIGIHLPSFSNTNKNLFASYNSNKDLLCKSGPRFRMYPKLKAEDSILVFPHPPEFITRSNDSTKNGLDADPSFIIGNPGRLADPLEPQKKVKNCAIIRECLGTRDEHSRNHPRNFTIIPKPKNNNSTTNSTNTKNPTNITNSTNTQHHSQIQDRHTYQPLATRLIISPQKSNSARELCESSTSWGHSFASTHEKLFCDMTDKTLYYTCSNEVQTCCLDTATETFRACREDSKRPPVAAVDRGANTDTGTTAVIRAGVVNGGLDGSMSGLKGRSVYESVQRW